MTFGYAVAASSELAAVASSAANGGIAVPEELDKETWAILGSQPSY